MQLTLSNELVVASCGPTTLFDLVEELLDPFAQEGARQIKLALNSSASPLGLTR
jgi:hypothetical protein